MKNLISIIFLFSCFTLTCQELENKIALNDTFINMSDDQLKELEQKLESEDPTFRFKFLSENDVSFFLAAQREDHKILFGLISLRCTLQVKDITLNNWKIKMNNKSYMKML